MQVSVTFRHMDATDALKEYAHDRLERIKKYFPDREPISCDVVLTTEKNNHRHRVDVNVQLHNGFRLAGHESTENMYSSIDMVSAKIERQARRYKEKLRGHKVRDIPSLPVVHSVIAEEPKEEVKAEVQEAPPATKPKVVAREEVVATAMTVEEAIMQLNLLHADFHVFRNEDSQGRISVVYRRPDGAFGLIETST